MKTLLKALVFGSFLLSNPITASEITQPTPARSAAVCKGQLPVHCSNLMFAAASKQPWDIPEPGPDLSGDKQLPQRFAERGAAKAGAAVGLAIGSVFGLSIFGTPGAAVGGALGGVLGEVLGEWLAGSILSPANIFTQPRWQMPLSPAR